VCQRAVNATLHLNRGETRAFVARDALHLANRHVRASGADGVAPAIRRGSVEVHDTIEIAGVNRVREVIGEFRDGRPPARTH